MRYLLADGGRVRVAHYEILDKIGHGGMGIVCRARNTHLDHFLAIKVLPAMENFLPGSGAEQE